VEELSVHFVHVAGPTKYEVDWEEGNRPDVEGQNLAYHQLVYGVNVADALSQAGQRDQRIWVHLEFLFHQNKETNYR